MSSIKDDNDVEFNTLAAACITSDTFPMEKCITGDTCSSQCVNDSFMDVGLRECTTSMDLDDLILVLMAVEIIIL